MRKTAGRVAKDERLEIRLSSSAKSLLGHAAQMRHTTISEFILTSAVAAAEEAVAMPKVFFADEGAWAQIMEMTDENVAAVPEEIVSRVKKARVNG